MKKGLIILLGCAILTACNTTDKKAGAAVADKGNVLKDSANFTTIEWLDSTHRNLGKVTEGDLVEVSYRFKNTGTKPLIITSVTASCGCTIPETPQEPFAPGAEGLIKAKFNSKSRTGQNHKEVYVTAYTKPDNLQQLEFTIEVENKKETN
ncbi:MAG: hypothetical protein JWM28_2017 [Chitinophagaceae bacterium]|nr:hypothetical protein [Chitinophagaceae bacterium]